MTLPGPDHELSGKPSPDPELDALLAMQASCFNYARAAYYVHAQMCSVCETAREGIDQDGCCSLGAALAKAVTHVAWRHGG